MVAQTKGRSSPRVGNYWSREGPYDAFERTKDGHIDRYGAHDRRHETAPEYAHAPAAATTTGLCVQLSGGAPQCTFSCTAASTGADAVRLHARLDHVERERA